MKSQSWGLKVNLVPSGVVCFCLFINCCFQSSLAYITIIIFFWKNQATKKLACVWWSYGRCLPSETNRLILIQYFVWFYVIFCVCVLWVLCLKPFFIWRCLLSMLGIKLGPRFMAVVINPSQVAHTLVVWDKLNTQLTIRK